MNNANPSPFVVQALAELNARCEIDNRKAALLKADPTFRRVDANTLHETYTCAAATGEAIRAMIVEVCKSFGIRPADLGYMIDVCVCCGRAVSKGADECAACLEVN